MLDSVQRKNNQSQNDDINIKKRIIMRSIEQTAVLKVKLNHLKKKITTSSRIAKLKII